MRSQSLSTTRALQLIYILKFPTFTPNLLFLFSFPNLFTAFTSNASLLLKISLSGNTLLFQNSGLNFSSYVGRGPSKPYNSIFKKVVNHLRRRSRPSPLSSRLSTNRPLFWHQNFLRYHRLFRSNEFSSLFPLNTVDHEVFSITKLGILEYPIAESNYFSYQSLRREWWTSIKSHLVRKLRVFTLRNFSHTLPLTFDSTYNLNSSKTLRNLISKQFLFLNSNTINWDDDLGDNSWSTTLIDQYSSQYKLSFELSKPLKTPRGFESFGQIVQLNSRLISSIYLHRFLNVRTRLGTWLALKSSVTPYLPIRPRQNFVFVSMSRRLRASNKYFWEGFSINISSQLLTPSRRRGQANLTNPFRKGSKFTSMCIGSSNIKRASQKWQSTFSNKRTWSKPLPSVRRQFILRRPIRKLIAQLSDRYLRYLKLPHWGSFPCPVRNKSSEARFKPIHGFCRTGTPTTPLLNNNLKLNPSLGKGSALDPRASALWYLIRSTLTRWVSKIPTPKGRGVRVVVRPRISHLASSLERVAFRGLRRLGLKHSLGYRQSAKYLMLIKNSLRKVGGLGLRRTSSVFFHQRGLPTWNWVLTSIITNPLVTKPLRTFKYRYRYNKSPFWSTLLLTWVLSSRPLHGGDFVARLPQVLYAGDLSDLHFHPNLSNSLSPKNPYHPLMTPMFSTSRYFSFRNFFKVRKIFEELPSLTFFKHLTSVPKTIDLGDIYPRRCIQSSYSLPFVLSPVGFILLTRSGFPTYLLSTLNLSRIKSKFNSYRLSFFNKNDLKRLLVKKPSFLKLLLSFRDHDTLTEFDIFSNEPRALTPYKPFSSLHNSPTVLGTYYMDLNFSSVRYASRYFSETSVDDIEVGREVLLKRIKFKPGYQRLWRTARAAINYTLGYNCRYQGALTRRLTRLRRVSGLDNLKLQELNLLRILVSARLVFDRNSSLQLISGQTVFLNGVLATNPKSKLFLGDLVQLIVNLRYYIIHKWLINWNHHHALKFSKLLSSKANTSKVDLSKQTSFRWPDWIFTIGYRTMDIPKYLEVDYLSLSAYLLYEPHTTGDLSTVSYLETRPNLYSSYNWKFIN